MAKRKAIEKSSIPETAAKPPNGNGSITTSQLEVIRHILAGRSAIDLDAIPLEDRDQIRAFMRQNGYDLDDPHKRQEANAVHREAVEFSARNFPDFKLHKNIKNPDKIEKIFEIAVGQTNYPQIKPHACYTLRVMQAINYAKRDPLISALPNASEYLTDFVKTNFPRENGGSNIYLAQPGNSKRIPIVHVEARTKTFDRVIMKLLQKPENIHALDHIGIRIITREPLDSIRIIHYLVKNNMIPWNQLIYEESMNRLLNPSIIEKICKDPDLADAILDPYKTDMIDHEELTRIDEAGTTDNPFTAKSYRAIHFLVWIPLPNAAGQIINFPLEFQIVNLASHQHNVSDPETSHPGYVNRQRKAVWERLSHGLEIPEPTPRKVRKHKRSGRKKPKR